MFVGHAGDDRLFIVEQGGVIKIWKERGGAGEAFLGHQRRVLDGGERGLLGLAFEPNYATTKRFYVYYTDPNEATRRYCHCALQRIQRPRCGEHA